MGKRAGMQNKQAQVSKTHRLDQDTAVSTTEFKGDNEHIQYIKRHIRNLKRIIKIPKTFTSTHLKHKVPPADVWEILYR